MTILIGLTGSAGSGKDTFALALVTKGFVRAALADALKEVVAKLAGEPVSMYHLAEFKAAHCETLGMTRRAALQGVGNGMRGILGESIWINQILRKWEEEGNHATVITDVRYPSEAQWIVDAGGSIIRIVRPDFNLLRGEEATHISEAGIPDDLVTMEVLNDGTIGELHAEARKIAGNLWRTHGS